MIAASDSVKDDTRCLTTYRQFRFDIENSELNDSRSSSCNTFPIYYEIYLMNEKFISSTIDLIRLDIINTSLSNVIRFIKVFCCY